MLLKRRLHLDPKRSHLLLGPRRVGKSTFLHATQESAAWVDLLKTDVYFEYRANPSLLREHFGDPKLHSPSQPIVIDEIQLIPELIREVHWLIENRKLKFILSGSSARKLKKNSVTNLAGRLSTAHLFPLTEFEIPDFELKSRLQWGCLPPIVFSQNPKQDLRDYCGEYLREEVQAEGLTRNLPAFTRFLELSALSNGELLSFTTIARDCGIAPKTAREYFQILVDTLIGHTLDPWIRSKKRRAILTPKFYFFDCGIPNSLLNRVLSSKTPEFGKSFEQFMILEAIAAKDYDHHFDSLTYWRTASGFEVDLLIDDHTAVEFKTGKASIAVSKGLNALSDEMKLKNRWIVGMEERPRKLENGVLVLPWRNFLRRLREGEF